MKMKIFIGFLTATAVVSCALCFTACGNGSGNEGDNGHTHEYTQTVVAPTCTERGYTLHKCNDCDDSYKDGYVNALNHDLQHHAAQTATCKNFGWNEYDTCSRCGYTTYEEISKLNHTYSNYICTSCYCVDPSAPDLEGLQFALNNDGESYKLSGKGTASGDYLKIPAEYDGKPVTAVGEDAFEYERWNFIALYIPDSIIEIGEYVFCGNASLKSVFIPDSVTEIKADTFEYCSSLNYVSLGNNLTEIGQAAFLGTALENVIIPETVKVVDCLAFSGCENLMSVKIPAGVTRIGSGAFVGCEFILDENNKNFVIVDGVLFNSQKTELICYGGDKTRTEYTVPNGVTICNYAFAFAPLEKIIVSEGITAIDDGTFTACQSLKSITLPETLKSIGNSAFEGCSTIENIVIPDGVTSIGGDAFTGCSSLKTITFPSSLTKMGQYLFDMCGSLTEIIFKGTVEQWNEIEKPIAWAGTSDFIIRCIDGNVNS